MAKPAERKDDQIAALIFPLLVSIALLSLLFPTWKPSIAVFQPFKAELAISVALIGFFGWQLFRNTDRWWEIGQPTKALVVCFASFTAWSAVSAIWAEFRWAAVHHTLLWALLTCVFAAAATMPRGSRFVLTVFTSTSLLLAVICVLDYAFVGDFWANEGQIRVRYGKYAEMLIVIAPALWAVSLYGRSQVGLLPAIAAAGAWLVVMLSLSKGAFLAGVGGFVTLFAGALFVSRLDRRKVLLSAAAWIVLTVAVQALFPLVFTAPSTADYISGAADPTRSTTAMRVFTWKVGLRMFRDHPLVGVGADNFGTSFYDARAAWRAENSQDTTPEIAEDYLVERSHNEPLQIAAELGVIGLLLVPAPMVVFVIALFRRWRQRSSFTPLLIGAIAGMTAFLTSSLVSSFSFRSVPGAVVFMLVMGVAARKTGSRIGRVRTEGSRRRTAAAGLIVSLLLATYSVVNAVATYHVVAAEQAADHELTNQHFEKALWWNPSYAGAWYASGARAASQDDIPRALSLIERSVENGLKVIQIYSHLAKLQQRTGDPPSSDRTYREALRIYPRSVYLLVEYAVFLERAGDTARSKEMLDRAIAVDRPQANGWHMLMTQGSVNAFFRSRVDPEVAAPNDLRPEALVRQYLDRSPGS